MSAVTEDGGSGCGYNVLLLLAVVPRHTSNSDRVGLADDAAAASL